MQVINIIFLVMYTTEIDIIITNKKQLLFIVFIFHEEVKRGMISFENTHKSIYIHVFIISVAQKNWEMPVMNIIYWLMYTTKITLFYINEKQLIFVGGRFHENDIFWRYTQKDFY